MEIIEISILNGKLQYLGIDDDKQEEEWVDFKFAPNKLTGYWVVVDDDGRPTDINVYIGGHSFISKYNKYNIDKLDAILNENSN